MPRLAIIIPFAGNPKRLEETLVSVLENRPEDCEILVVLGQTYENPYNLEDEVRFLRVPEGAGVIEGINQAVQASRAAVVHVLRCGSEVCDGWVEPALGHFDDLRIATVAPLVLDAQQHDRVVAAGVEYSKSGRIRWLEQGQAVSMVDARARSVLAPHSAAVFYRRSALELTGGFRTEIGERLACLDLALTLKFLGFKAMVEPQCQVSAPPAESDGGAYRMALEAERLFWRWAPLMGSSLVGHACEVARDCLGGLKDFTVFARLAGRLKGLGAAGSASRHWDRLRQLQELQRASAGASPATVPPRSNGSSHANRLPGAASSKSVPPTR